MYLLFPVGFYCNSKKQSQAKSDVNILSWSFEMFCLGPGRLLPESGEPAILLRAHFEILIDFGGSFSDERTLPGGSLKKFMDVVQSNIEPEF